jgi:hypothetical protein
VKAVPAISFSTMKDKILSGQKKQTIRPYSEYWMKWRTNDRLIGFWKMRTKACEKLFDSTFSEDPFVISWLDFNDDLMKRDGFKDLLDGNEKWFIPHYGSKLKRIDILKLFTVIRWK